MLTFLETTDSVTAGNHIHRKQVTPLNTNTNLPDYCGEVLTEMSFVTGVRLAACSDPELSHVMFRKSAGRLRWRLPSVASHTTRQNKKKSSLPGGEILKLRAERKEHFIQRAI
jgi:hypothetical protein